MKEQRVHIPRLPKKLNQTTTQVVDSPSTNQLQTSNDESEGYQCISLSSSPECDSSVEVELRNVNRNVVERAKFAAVGCEAIKQTFGKSHLPYCGSETESEHYASYGGFYAGDEGAEEDQDWKGKKDMEIGGDQRRGRSSIVHTSLEDNYGAVVVANHEALAQLLEQLHQSGNPSDNAALKSRLPRDSRLSEFQLSEDVGITIGQRVFREAAWREDKVTLCLDFDQSARVQPPKEFHLAPLIEFTESVSHRQLKSLPASRGSLIARVSVYPHQQVRSVQSFAVEMKTSREQDWRREGNLVLLQLVNGLKKLQTWGVERVPKDLSNLVLCKDNKEPLYRLYFLPRASKALGQSEDEVSLCKCAINVMEELLLTKQFPLVRELLAREEPLTLSRVKSVLEFSLWGPSDVSFEGDQRQREVTFQRWLDLERANVLHALVRTRSTLTLLNEYQLLFLVRTSARIMSEASILLERQQTLRK